MTGDRVDKSPPTFLLNLDLFTCENKKEKKTEKNRKARKKNMLVHWRDDSLDEKCFTTVKSIGQTKCWPLARPACRSNVPAPGSLFANWLVYRMKKNRRPLMVSRFSTRFAKTNRWDRATFSLRCCHLLRKFIAIFVESISLFRTGTLLVYIRIDFYLCCYIPCNGLLTISKIS